MSDEAVTRHVTFTCRHCGDEEPNEFLLDNNHWPHREESCIAQFLVSNHLRYALRQLQSAHKVVVLRKREEHIAFYREEVERKVAWLKAHRVDVDAIFDEFPNPVCRACDVGNCHHCHGSMTVDERTQERTDCSCQHEEKETT